MIPIEPSIDEKWLLTLDVLTRREGPPASEDPEETSFWETMGERQAEPAIAAFYAAAERATTIELREQFRELTAGYDFRGGEPPVWIPFEGIRGSMATF
ncbi:MAG: hypothetical protein LAP87_15370 [Acidobacteriia bacterium]|nr:hypothetical protein [Terriglobia bacterium]